MAEHGAFVMSPTAHGKYVVFIYIAGCITIICGQLLKILCICQNWCCCSHSATLVGWQSCGWKLLNWNHASGDYMVGKSKMPEKRKCVAQAMLYAWNKNPSWKFASLLCYPVGRWFWKEDLSNVPWYGFGVDFVVNLLLLSTCVCRWHLQIMIMIMTFFVYCNFSFATVLRVWRDMGGEVFN